MSADAGNAVVEAVLVTVVLGTLFLAILQLGLAMHVKNTLVACAADGARYGANANRTPEEGADYTRRRIRAALADRFADNVEAEVRDGVVTVSVRAHLPLIGVWGAQALPLHATGSAFDERQVAP